MSRNLSSSKLRGEIAPSFLNLTALESLDLSHNELSGPLPKFLADLRKLRFLNLTGNNLSGSIPESLAKKHRDGELVLSLTENPGLCQGNVCPEEKHSSKKGFLVPVAASTVSVLALILLIGLAVFWRTKKQMEGVLTINSTNKGPLVSKIRPFSYSEVVRITVNFKTIIGEGGFGKVYHGSLDDGTEVAVKMLSPSSKQGYNEFQAEAQLLLIVHHRNLVSLVGYCDDDEYKALIYEYMAKGNLQQHLSVTNPNVLSWHKRLQIAVHAAQGLEYLHNGCKPSIIHRDLKTSNILLDENMCAKIADFGLSKMFKSETMSHLSTRPVGTLGYLDPEYQTSGNLNKKSDVYSFGIILFQLITGHPAILRGHFNNTHIVQWIHPIIERGDIQSIVDARLQGDFNHNSAWKVLEIAMSCVPSTPIQRPDMNHVLAELKECLEIEMIAPRRAPMVGNIMNNSMELIEPSAR